jgi:DNA-directed RNA polymerase specialized sigma24 family protein
VTSSNSSGSPGGRPDSRTLLRALVALLPSIARRVDLGFTRDAREDALMSSILRLLEAEEREAEEDVPLVDAVARRYASRMVQNYLIDEFRRSHRDLPFSELPSEAADPASDAESKPGLESGPGLERVRVARALLRDLEAKDRALLEAYFSGADAFREESQRQSLKSGTARVKVHRLLRRLRERGASSTP